MQQLASVGYYDLLLIYCGHEPRALPPELCNAGLCGRGNSCTFFWVYF